MLKIKNELVSDCTVHWHTSQPHVHCNPTTLIEELEAFSFMIFSVCVCVYSATLDSSRVFFPLKYFPLQHFACHDVTDTIHHSITLVTLIYALKIFCWVNSVPYPNPPLPVLPTLLLSDGFILILRLYLLWVCNFSKQTLNQCKALLTKMVGS